MDDNKKRKILSKMNTAFDKAIFDDSRLIEFDDKILNEISESLLSEDNRSKRFSKGFLKNKILNIIERMSIDGNSKNALYYLDEMLKELELYSLNMVIYVPLSGIKMWIPHIKIGNIAIRYMDEDNVAELIARSHGRIRLHEYIFKCIYENTCSEFHIVAEPNYALDQGEKETRRVIDLIRYAILELYGGPRAKVGLPGDFLRMYRHAIAINSDGSKFCYHGSLIGPLFDFEMSPENIRRMEKIGVFKLSKMLQEENLNEFKSAILSSLHWFANSQMKTELEDQFLNLITCLEVIFTPRGRDPITQNIAEGTAITICNNVIDRKNMTAQIRKLYSLRSSLSHYGKGEVTNIALLELTQIDARLLRSLIEISGEFKTLKEFHEWIEYRRLLGGRESASWKEYYKSIFEKN